MQYPDTIIALATPPGRSGVAVVRASGPQAAACITALGARLPVPRRAALATLTHPATGEPLDRALLLYFPGPGSFTGEDVAEFHLHGSRAVIGAVVDALLTQPGVRMAEPGEFTRRAFLNGKMDLTEVEGLADLIDAETGLQRAQALRALSGQSGRRFEALRKDAITVMARLEAWIDFPDEDIPAETWAAAVAGIGRLRADIRALLDDGRRGERIREGLSVVILGAPNAGKSSLMNALARRDVAIVSGVAGTTRDVIETHLDLGGVPVVLVDTAGLRDSADEVEQEGIRRARARAAAADIRIVCFDGAALPGLDAESQGLVGASSIPVATKCDLARHAAPEGYLTLSAATGEGMDALLSALQSRVAALTDTGHSPDAGLLTRARHRHALERALTHLDRFSPALLPELACEELRRAAVEIGKITGKIVVDEVLDHVFREFCIGK